MPKLRFSPSHPSSTIFYVRSYFVFWSMSPKHDQNEEVWSSEWKDHTQKPLSPLWIPTWGLNHRGFANLSITQMQDGDDWAVLRPHADHILILAVTYQTLTFTSITLWNHDALLFTHSTFAFLSVHFSFCCLIVTKNSKVTLMFCLFLFLHLHLQLDTKEFSCCTICRLSHSCYSFLFVPMLPTWRKMLMLMIYI